MHAPLPHRHACPLPCMAPCHARPLCTAPNMHAPLPCAPPYHACPLWTEFLTHASENITLPQRRFYTCLSFCSQRLGCLPHTPSLLGRPPPLWQTPPRQTSPRADPPSQCMLGYTAQCMLGYPPYAVHAGIRSISILLECILVFYCSQWRIQDFPDVGGGTNAEGGEPTYYLSPFLPKTA